jgi:hypothetical protein
MTEEKEMTGEERKNVPVLAYPYVELGNSTLYTVDFVVYYAGCSTDYQTVNTMKTGAGLPRGVCLVTTVKATVRTTGGNTVATPYTSSGTSYSQFACILYKNNYVVTRVEW